MKLFFAGDFGLIWKPYAVATLHVLAFPVSFENSRKLLKSFSFLGQGYGESLSSKLQFVRLKFAGFVCVTISLCGEMIYRITNILFGPIDHIGGL